MHFKYLSLFRILGLALPSGKSEMTLIECRSIGLKAILTSDIDHHLFIKDRGDAIKKMMGTASLGSKGSNDLEPKLNENINCIREQRKKQFNSGCFIIFEFTGKVEALDNLHTSPSEPLRDFGDFTINFDIVDEAEIKNKFKNKINHILTSLLLVNNYQIDKVTDGLYLLSKEGKVYYSYSPRVGKLKAIPTIPINDVFLEQISNYSQIFSKTTDFERVCRLLIQAAIECDDNLRSFLFAWTALEIFINKIFKEYKPKFLETYKVNQLPSLNQKLFDRLEEDECSIQDRFIVISSLLSQEDAEEDLDKFRSVKKVRNDLVHGEDIDEDSLPTPSVVSLLRKYLKLHLEAVTT